MGFLRQEYWSGLPFPSPGYFPNPGIDPESPALQPDSLPLSYQGSPYPPNKSLKIFPLLFDHREKYLRDKGFMSYLFEVDGLKKKRNTYAMKFPLFSHLLPPDGLITHLEPDILECEVKWVLESITTNKASGGDGIPVELFRILKDDAVKVLHSICQQIWKTQQWPQDWKRSVFIPIPKKGNAKE